AERDLVFVPVGINYDRVLEDRTLLARLDKDAPHRGPFYAIGRTLAFAAANLWLMVTGRWYRFGYACGNFGRPGSMRAWGGERSVDFRLLSEAERHQEVERVARVVMAAVARIIPVLPVSLVASVFARDPQAGLSELELKSEVYELIRQLEAVGAHIYVPRGDLDYAVGVGLRMLTLRHIVSEEEGLYRGNPADRDVIA